MPDMTPDNLDIGGDGAMTTVPPDVAGRVVYISSPGVRLSVRNGRLLVCHNETGAVLLSRPLQVIDTIVITSPVSLTTPLMKRCVREGIDIALLTGRGQWVGRMSSDRGLNPAVLSAQLAVHADAETSLRYARAFVEAKMRSQRVVIRRRNRRLEDVELDRAARRLHRLIKRIPAVTTLEELNGLEGLAARTYFGCFNRMLHPQSGFTFAKRTRRPPRDEVNALLSFLYTLLQGEADAACRLAGLLPQTGFLHRGPVGAECLAFDLMEPFRPAMADVVVLRLINRKQLTPNDFTRSEEGVFLTPEARRVVMTAWDERRHEASAVEGFEAPLPWYRIILYEARRLAKSLETGVPPRFVTMR